MLRMEVEPVKGENMNYNVKTIVEFELKSGRKARLEYNPEKVDGRAIILDGISARLFVDGKYINLKEDSFSLYYKTEFIPDNIQNLEDMGILDDYLN